MPFSSRSAILFVLFSLLFSSAVKADLPVKHQQRRLVAMRMIGHQVLLGFGDSTSRVLPIHHENHQYRIEFETEFAFNPDSLVAIINGVIRKAEVANGYHVDVVACQTEEIVYSFEVDFLTQLNLLPCKERDQPKACYSLAITLFNQSEASPPAVGTSHSGIKAHWPWAIPLVLGMVIMGIVFTRKRATSRPELLAIGQLRFNPITGNLLLDNETIDLSGKEARLLLLLLNHKNQTVARDDILHHVWNDEGAYVGRTLDVFISKLRKKLEADPTVKIMNERGVGYKLVTDS